MAAYDLEEQDAIEDLKAWWNRWGTLVTWIVVAAAAVIVGVQGWRWWQAKRADEASARVRRMIDGGRLPRAIEASKAGALFDSADGDALLIDRQARRVCELAGG